jgi:transcriptional regulator with XRE-family HTH domain
LPNFSPSSAAPPAAERLFSDARNNHPRFAICLPPIHEIVHPSLHGDNPMPKEPVLPELSDADLRMIELRKEMGRHIASLRKSRGLTQTFVAKQVKTHQYVISEFEAGKRDIRMHLFLRILESLNLEPRLVSIAEIPEMGEPNLERFAPTEDFQPQVAEPEEFQPLEFPSVTEIF